ncbi:MAG: DUF3298 domain-containing protein [Bacteroidales bacterium]|nr:DUF3298 domain-containing protein [Bacteroidales bacterium]
MKNFCLTAVWAVLCISLVSSCKQAAGPMQMDTFRQADSLAHVRLSFDIELPAGKTPAAAVMRTRLQEVLDNRLSSATSFEGDRLFEPFSGDRSDTQAYAGYYFTELMDKMSEQLDADVNERLTYMQEDPSFTEEDMSRFLAEIPDWEYDYTLKVLDQTPKYIVFHSQDYTYLGGAHGGVGGDGCLTFSKKDGSFVEKLIDRSQEDAMQPLLVAGLLRYYKEMDVEMSEAELLDNLMIENRHIPLPTWEPYPTAEGLVFTYHQYEIASYAEGMPAFTVPYEEIQPYLTETFRQLL